MRHAAVMHLCREHAAVEAAVDIRGVGLIVELRVLQLVSMEMGA